MITIHALGDSLVKAYGEDEHNFIGGWGDHLWSFFDTNKVQVKVYAQGGRSSRSFLNEGRFIENGNFSAEEFPYLGAACNHIQKGDYVLIQFSHNDDDSKDMRTYAERMTPLGKPDEQGIYPTIVPTESMKESTEHLPPQYRSLLEKEGTPQQTIETYMKNAAIALHKYGTTYWSYGCGATYKGYLKFYIDKVRELGAVPVIVTAAARQYFENGKIIPVLGHHGNRDVYGDFPYIRAARQIAQEENVVILDLFAKSCALFESLGESASRYLQSIRDKDGVTIGEASNNRPQKWVEDYDAYWENDVFFEVDNTHQNRLGSYLFAAILADSIYEEIPSLKECELACSSKEMACPKHIKKEITKIESFYKNIHIRLK